MPFFIGVDGGGSKTAFALSYANGIPIVQTESIGCSYQSVGLERAADIIADGIKKCSAQAGEPLENCAYSTILQPFRQDMQCGCCDERLYWHPKTNQWFCRRCGMWAKPLRAEETSAAIAEKLCWLRQNPEIIHTPEGQANVQSVEVALLDREIWQALTNAEPDVDALVAKILHRAEMEYKFCTAGDADPVTLQIQKACAEYKPTEEFPETFYKEVISKVILYRDTHIEFKLQNGQIV